MTTVFRVLWRDRAGVLHATAPRFGRRVKAVRFARWLRGHPDITEARARIGYEPSVSFLDGLKRTVAWYSAQPKSR